MSLDFEKLNDHARKHDEFVEKMRQSQSNSRRRAQTPLQSEMQIPTNYRNKFYQRTLEQEQTRKEMEEAKAELK